MTKFGTQMQCNRTEAYKIFLLIYDNTAMIKLNFIYLKSNHIKKDYL